MLDYEFLKLVWWVLVGVLLIGWAIADGIDMGTAMVMPWVGKTDHERRVVINTIAPHWDGNQVWLITAGGALFAAWPLVYAISFSGFYFAILLVLFGLFFRPVGFDYRSKIETARWRRNWDRLIWVGSAVPSLVFGVAFGNLLQGVPFQVDTLMRASYTGTLFGLLNPFALLCGIISVVMLAAHGSIWLMARADMVVAERARKAVLCLLPVLALLFVLAGIWMSLAGMGYRLVEIGDVSTALQLTHKTVTMQPWLIGKGVYVWIAPVVALVSLVLAMVLVRCRLAGWGLVCSGLMMGGIIATAGVAMFPFVMPSNVALNASLTLWDATSSARTLSVMFWVALVMTPIILAYTTWCYAKMWRRLTVERIEQESHALY